MSSWLLLIYCLTTSPHQAVSLQDKIELVHRNNERLKEGKLFQYRYYINAPCDSNFDTDYTKYPFLDCEFADTSNYIYYKSTYPGDMQKNPKAESTTIISSTILLYDKRTLISYNRVPVMAHAQFKKTNYPGMEITPYNYAVIGHELPYTLDRLLRETKERKFTLEIKPLPSNKTICHFHGTTIAVHFDFILNNDEQFTIEKIIVPADKDRLQDNTSQVTLSKYVKLADGLWYPQRYHIQLLQQGRTVKCGMCDITNVRACEDNDSVMHDNVAYDSTVNIDNMRWSTIKLAPQRVDMITAAKIYADCEAMSVSKLSNLAKDNRGIYIAAGSVLSILVVSLLFWYIRSSNRPNPNAA